MTRVIDRHGLKLKGLMEACSETRSLVHHPGHIVEIMYWRSTDEVIAMDSRDAARLIWPKADKLDVIPVTHTFHPMTMQEIADAVYKAIHPE